MFFKKNPEIVAAVDLGSNSFHMIVARTQQGQLHVIDAIKEMVRLGSGITAEHGIDAITSARALECLQRFGQRLAHMHPNHVRVVGTNALRRASHGLDFLNAAENALGCPVEIISGIEEARLIYRGVCQCMPDRESRSLVIDIGGGSTEVIIGQNANPELMESLHIGCISLSMQFFKNGEISEQHFRKAVLAAHQEFEPIALSYKQLGWQQVFGSSGTARCIADNVAALKLTNGHISLDTLYSLRNRAIASGHVDKLKLPLLPPERAAVFPGGLAILIAAFEALGIEQMLASDCALREGILYELIGTNEKMDMRSHTITNLCARYHADMQHASRIEATCLQLYDQIAKHWEIDEPDMRRMLRWTIALHELGLAVSHSRYQMHGAYLIEHSDLPGFNRQEQAEVATLIRLHRRKIHQEFLNKYTPARQQQLLKLALIIRLAVVLHRSRNKQPMPKIKITVDKKEYTLKFPENWLQQHPLTEVDLEQEAEFIEAVEYSFKYQ